MPAQAGENTLSTVFSDVHYVFSQPGQRPVHDRFEKGSYVYIHHNPTSSTGRIEIANNAGTPEQDAFDGSLEFARISFTHKRPSHLSIAIVPSAPGAQWQLPSYAPGQDKKYMYPIHELDLYFWTAEDAKQTLEAARKVRSVNALNVQDAPPQQTPQHAAGGSDAMSPVVQKLEQAAIGTSYQQSHRDSGSVNSSIVQAHAFAPPPPPSKSAASSQHEQATETYKPVAAYNPAAPSAPEPIAHREKTPPPPDGSEGTGLHGQGGQPYHGQQGPYQPGLAHQQQAGPYQYTSQSQSPFSQSFTPSSSGPTSFVGPPQGRQSIHSATPPQRASSGSSFPPPPPKETSSAASQYPFPSTSPRPTISQQAFQPGSYHSGPTSPDFRSPLQSPGFAPPPNTSLSGQHLQQQQQHHYSQFSYAQPAGQVQTDAHSIHQQVYRPTEHEAAQNQGNGSSSSQGQASGLGSRADRLEKGVGRFLKKMDKKLGI